MKNIINFIYCEYEKQLNFTYVLIFSLAIFFTFFFRKGIEFTRYVLIALTLIIIIAKPKYFEKILHNCIFLILFIFIIISGISLMYNNASIGKIDDAANWALFYIFGFVTFHILKDNISYVVYSIPIILFLCQVLYPFSTGTLIENLNFLSGKRLDLFFSGKPIHLGIFAGISTFIALYVFIKSNNMYTKITYFTLAFFSFIVLLSTGTRTSFVGTTVTIAFMGIYFFNKKIRLSYLIFATISILIITSLFIINKSELRISSLADSEEITDSFLEREIIFLIAKDSFLRSPVIGEGFDRFSEIYQDNVKKYYQSNNADKKYAYIHGSSNNAHNFSLHFLTETGALGFLCMNAFWLLTIYGGLKSNSDPARIISGVYLLSYIVFQFNMSLYGTQISTLLFSLAGLSGAAIQKYNLNELDFRRNS